MDSPDSDSNSDVMPGEPPNHAPEPAPGAAPPTAREGESNVNEHFSAPPIKGFHFFSSKSRKAAKSSLRPYAGWEQPQGTRRPYHQYVHELVQAGWETLAPLDRHMEKDIEDRDLVISVMDTSDNLQTKRWPDIHDGLALKHFLEEDNRSGVKVRLYLAEQKGEMSSGVMEAFGGSLALDPRFFQWSIWSRDVMVPSERHRAPFLKIGFAVPEHSTAPKAGAERFNITVYIQPGEDDTWTGILLFSCHTKIKLSARNLTSPPLYNAARPTPIVSSSRTLRELYLETFTYLDHAQAIKAPFYAISPLFRLNYLFWGRVINGIRDEDRKINGISNATVDSTEAIQKSLKLVQRGGSLGWPGSNERLAVQTQQALEEDFKHLVDQTALLWQTRAKMKEVRQHKSEVRWTTLTNTFTYVFAPVTIMSGVYGMNVSEISGSSSSPSIWQFFAGVAILNLVVVLALALSNWLHIAAKHGRKASAKEVFGFAVGKPNK